MVLSTRTSGRIHSRHKPREIGTCLVSPRAKSVVTVAAAAAGATPIGTVVCIGTMGMEALNGEPDMGTTGVRDGWTGAASRPDVMWNGMSWVLERGAARSPPLHSMVELEVERGDGESWGRREYAPSKVSAKAS